MSLKLSKKRSLSHPHPNLQYFHPEKRVHCHPGKLVTSKIQLRITKFVLNLLLKVGDHPNWWGQDVAPQLSWLWCGSVMCPCQAVKCRQIWTTQPTEAPACAQLPFQQDGRHGHSILNSADIDFVSGRGKENMFTYAVSSVFLRRQEGSASSLWAEHRAKSTDNKRVVHAEMHTQMCACCAYTLDKAKHFTFLNPSTKLRTGCKQNAPNWWMKEKGFGGIIKPFSK